MATKKARLKNSGGDYIIPYVPVDSELSSTSENPVQNKVVNTALSGKQATLVSGTNIKTVGGNSLLGSGNVAFPTVDQTYSASSTNAQSGVAVANAIAPKQDTLVSGTNIKTLNGESLLGEGDIEINPAPDVDGTTISYNSSDALQTIAVKNVRDGSTLPIWLGTELQWIKGKLKIWYNWQTNSASPVATWTKINLSSTGSYKVIYADDKFVMSKGDGYVYNSTDGVTWTQVASLSSYSFYNVNALVYGDGKFVMLYNGKGAYSTDGVNWTVIDLPTNMSWGGLAYGDGKFVAVSQAQSEGVGVAIYSTDGVNWETVTGLPANNNGIYTLAYGNGKFVALYRDSAKGLYSTDGITWNTITLPSYGRNEQLIFADGKFVAVGGNKAFYSTDGIVWAQTSLPSGISWESGLTYGDGKFVAIRTKRDMDMETWQEIYSIEACASIDGVSWALVSPELSGVGASTAVYGAGKFVIFPEMMTNYGVTFTLQYDIKACYTDTANPTTTSVVYSAPDTASIYTISSVTSGAMTLSDNNTYYYNQSGNTQSFDTIGNAHPEYLCFIDGVGVKMNNTMIATNTPITTTITSSSTDAEAPSAKAVYDALNP